MSTASTPSPNPASSPFSHVLGTAYIPTDEEISAIEAFIQQPLEEISRIEKEVARLQRRIFNLRVTKQELKKNVQAHRALTSRSRRLPADVLAEIFTHCLPTTPKCRTHKAPLLLGQICRTWRETSRSTPRLWSSIHITVPETVHPSEYNKVVHDRCSGIRAWLDLSGHLPLSITLRAPASNAVNSEVTLPVNHFLRVISEFSCRWKDVHLELPYNSLSILQCLPFPSEGLPYLEEFHLVENLTLDQRLRIVSVLVTVASEVMPHCNSQFLMLSPKLRTLSLSYSAPMNLLIPSQQLTSLSMARVGSGRSLSLSNTVNILSRCNETLRSCSLTIASRRTLDENVAMAMGQAPTFTLEDRLLPFPRLQKLHVKNTEPADICRALFGCLGANTLQELSFINTSPTELATLPFEGMLKRWACPLRSLTIEVFSVTDDAIIPCLDSLPSLKKLVVGDWDKSVPLALNGGKTVALTDRLLAALTPNANSAQPVLCPSLQSFTFKNCRFTETALVNLIQSRSGPAMGLSVSRLSSAENIFPHIVLPGEDYGLELKSVLLEIRARGVAVSFDYPTFWKLKYRKEWEGILALPPPNYYYSPPA
ncbi:hypothetical protein HGRIS_010013 [Hohenbuehelia grisea]|uniref:F-box domain-containing protein n=1 Tax=Hohenbuehelia grisea TaxID=104357 RepID=A0ABR3J3C9_9AGAR